MTLPEIDHVTFLVEHAQTLFAGEPNSRAFCVRMRHGGLPCAVLAVKYALFTLSSQLAFEFLTGNIGNFNCFSLERFFDIRTYLLWL